MKSIITFNLESSPIEINKERSTLEETPTKSKIDSTVPKLMPTPPVMRTKQELPESDDGIEDYKSTDSKVLIDTELIFEIERKCSDLSIVIQAATEELDLLKSLVESLKQQ